MKDSKKLLEASMTIVLGGSNVDPNLLCKREMFIIKECLARLCALKRGGTLSHLHMQMVVKFHISSLKMLNKVLKEWSGWDDLKKLGMSCIASSYKTLAYIHLLVGHYMINIYEDHFQFIRHNVSGEMMEVSMLGFFKYKATLVKNQVYLTH